MTGRLDGRTALVTGAGSGIGRATALRLARDGARVLAADRVADRFAGLDMPTIAIDIATPDAADRLRAEVEAVLGGLDILVNNAGVCHVAAFADHPDSLWNDTLAINLSGMFRLSRAVLPLLKQSKAGRIINTGSILSTHGDANLVAYTTSKHGVLGFTRALAAELGPDGITVNCVEPGAIATGMTAAMLENEVAREHYVGRSVLGRIGQPEDIADVVAFFASDDARFVTGQGLMIDGGVTLRS